MGLANKWIFYPVTVPQTLCAPVSCGLITILWDVIGWTRWKSKAEGVIVPDATVGIVLQQAHFSQWVGLYELEKVSEVESSLGHNFGQICHIPVKRENMLSNILCMFVWKSIMLSFCFSRINCFIIDLPLWTETIIDLLLWTETIINLPLWTETILYFILWTGTIIDLLLWI